jgi:hypothetical protein
MGALVYLDQYALLSKIPSNNSSCTASPIYHPQRSSAPIIMIPTPASSHIYKGVHRSARVPSEESKKRQERRDRQKLRGDGYHCPVCQETHRHKVQVDRHVRNQGVNPYVWARYQNGSRQHETVAAPARPATASQSQSLLESTQDFLDNRDDEEWNFNLGSDDVETAEPLIQAPHQVMTRVEPDQSSTTATLLDDDHFRVDDGPAAQDLGVPALPSRASLFRLLYPPQGLLQLDRIVESRDSDDEEEPEGHHQPLQDDGEPLYDPEDVDAALAPQEDELPIVARQLSLYETLNAKFRRDCVNRSLGEYFFLLDMPLLTENTQRYDSPMLRLP